MLHTVYDVLQFLLECCHSRRDPAGGGRNDRTGGRYTHC